MKPSEENVIKAFNFFIKVWLPNYYPHLIDNDENDGEKFRQLVKDSFKEAQQKKDQEFLEFLYNVIGSKRIYKDVPEIIVSKIRELKRGK